MSTNFLFWNVDRNTIKKNTGKEKLEPILGDLARELDLGVIMLAETGGLDQPALLDALQNKTGTRYFEIPSECKKIRTYALNAKGFTERHASKRLSILEWLSPDGKANLLAIGHFFDKISYPNDTDRFMMACEWAGEIKQTEEKLGINRTVFVGDLNMNPFEVPAISASGFHGVSSKRVAKKVFRTIRQKQYPYFYNPMWNLLGDDNEPPGSFYYRNAGPSDILWNMLDQVMIRPELIPLLKKESIKLITQCNQQSFLTTKAKCPNPNFSDHLPLHFTFEHEKRRTPWPVQMPR